MRVRVLLACSAAAAMTVAAVTLGFGAVAAEGSGKGPFVNPDVGLTDPHRDARYSASRAEFEAKYADWKAHLDISKLDLRSLPHASITASYMAPPQDLESAMADADVIVVGKAVAIKSAMQGSILTFAVSEAWKREPGGTVTVVQEGGFEPGPDWKDVVISDAEPAPTLLPGDEALLFLKRSEQVAGGYAVQIGSGFYRVVDGRVVALPPAENPFGARLDGLSVADAGAAIRGPVRP